MVGVDRSILWRRSAPVPLFLTMTLMATLIYTSLTARPSPATFLRDTPTNCLYENNGDGTFTDVTEEAGVGDTGYGHGCAVGDYNNDGYLDLYVTNYGNNRLYRNNGDGTFTDVAEVAGVAEPRWSSSCAFADYDRDGNLDLYVVNYIVFDIDENPWVWA